MKTLKERFEAIGLSIDNFSATISGVSKSNNWYTFIANVVTPKNSIEQFVCKLNAGKDNAEYIKQTDDFFTLFKDGDYMLTNVQLRQAGETWNDEAGNTGSYKESYVSVPFTSSILYLGSDTVIANKRKESELAKIALQGLALVEE